MSLTSKTFIGINRNYWKCYCVSDSIKLLYPYRRTPHHIKHKGRFSTLRPRQKGRHFADDTFKCIFINENVRISINISLKFVPKGLINNIPALVQIMAWRRPGDKPLSEPMMVNLLTHICVTRPQWVDENLAVFKYARTTGCYTYYSSG